MPEQLVTSRSVFRRRSAGSFEARPVLEMPCKNKSCPVESGPRLQDGLTEVTPLMATRGY